MLQDAKGYLSACTQMKNAKMRHFPFHNNRTAADVLGYGRKSDFPAFANATNAEACVVADAGFCHIEITLFKNLQRQQGSRIKHGVERENWQNGHFTCHASGAGRLRSIVAMGFAPTRHQCVLYANLVENACYHEIDKLLDSMRPMIKTWIGRENDRSGARQFQHVLQMNRRQ